MAKLDKMTRFLPGLYAPTVNTYVKGLLYAWSGEDDKIASGVQDAKEQIYVKTAVLQYLDALGSNVGVFRPATINLADAQYRDLIPALSFAPKQIKPTIQKVLDAFFGANNSLVKISEINPNEIVIQIPSSVPALRRSLKGSHHFKNYSGTVTAINNIGKTVTVTLDQNSKTLKVDELKDAYFGQGRNMIKILSNTAGSIGVVIQFTASTNLAPLNTTDRFLVSMVKNYPGSFFPDPAKAYTVTKKRGVLGQSIVAGNIYPIITMQDSSGIPDAPGTLVFSFGSESIEEQIVYLGRPNNSTLLIDPSYTWQKNHSAGEDVNVTVSPYVSPSTTGDDYSIYLVGVTKARTLAQDIIESVIAAGIVVRWVLVKPQC